MIAKLALLALVLLIAWMVLLRPRRGASGPRQEPQALESCPRCGVYRLPAGACDCDPPTSED